jgi:hypothetical protein
MCHRPVRRNPNRYPKSILIPASLWFLVSVANAQILSIAHWTYEGGNRPVIADITTLSSSVTPWGIYTQVFKGKFWRSRDGKSRQDDPFGNTLLLTSKTETWVDRELQTAMVAPCCEWHHQSWHDLVASQSLNNALPTRRVRPGKLNGRAVMEINRSDAKNPLYSYVWIDVRTGVPIQILIKLGGTETIQQLSNIEEREPDPEFFKIPGGFSVLMCKDATKARNELSNRPVSCGAIR